MTRQYRRALTGSEPPGASVKIEISLHHGRLWYKTIWSHQPTPAMLEQYFEWRPEVLKDFEAATGIQIQMADAVSD